MNAAAAAAARATFTTDAAYNAGLAQYNEEQAVAGFVGGTFITDVSGGNFQEQYASPTPCIKTVEYTEIDGIWTLYQDNGTGNVHTHYGWGDITDTYDVRNKSTNIGSSGQRTTINDKTYAQTITTLVDSNGINATTSVDGDIVGVTTSTTITNSVDAKATVVNQTAAGASIISVNSAPTALNVNIVPVLTGNINVGALTFELAAGLKFALSATRGLGPRQERQPRRRQDDRHAHRREARRRADGADGEHRCCSPERSSRSPKFGDRSERREHQARRRRDEPDGREVLLTADRAESPCRPRTSPRSPSGRRSPPGARRSRR